MTAMTALGLDGLESDVSWRATWTQAVTDFRGDDEEPPLRDVTVRMTVPASIGGTHLRVELSNRFGDEAVHIGKGVITLAERSVEVSFDGRASVDIPAGESLRTDPVAIAVEHNDEITLDLYLPNTTEYATANGFRYQRAERPGDFAGSREFTSSDPGGTGLADHGSGWLLPSGGPFLRAIEVAGGEAQAVVVCLGASITTLGWPQLTSASLPAEACVAVLNRGIPGNRLRFDAPSQHASWGPSGISRFDDDVLGTAGVTHVVLAHASNDIGLPGQAAPLAELPSAVQQIEAYQQLITRAAEADLTVMLATITPMPPEHAHDPRREQVRLAVNDWMRGSGHDVADFDKAIRSSRTPSQIAPEYDVGDHQHPNITGQSRLAQTMVSAITTVQAKQRPSSTRTVPR